MAKRKTKMAYHAHTLVDVMIDGRVILDKCCLRLTLNFWKKQHRKQENWFLLNIEIQYLFYQRKTCHLMIEDTIKMNLYTINGYSNIQGFIWRTCKKKARKKKSFFKCLSHHEIVKQIQKKKKLNSRCIKKTKHRKSISFTFGQRQVALDCILFFVLSITFTNVNETYFLMLLK